MSTARKQRYLTFAQVLEYIPRPEQSPELLERLYSHCQAESIEIYAEARESSSRHDQHDDDLEQDELDTELENDGLDANDPVRLYLREIGRVSLLTAQEEIVLAQQIERGERAAERLRRSEYTIEERPQLQRWCLESDGAREYLIRANLRLVVSIAKKYLGRGMSFLDLIQEGNLGLMR